MQASGAHVRTVGAVATLLAFWTAAYVCTILAIVIPLGDFDNPTSSGRWVARVATVMAVLLYLASGPVSYFVGRRRAFLAAPVLLAGVAAAAVMIADVT